MFLTHTHLAIAMEYAPGGDLFRYVLRHKAARLAEAQARWIFQQLVIGLDFCHRSVWPRSDRHPPLLAAPAGFWSCVRFGLCCSELVVRSFEGVWAGMQQGTDTQGARCRAWPTAT